MKRAVIVALVIVISSLYFSSALRINEVMPDCGNLSANCEFVEFFSKEVQDLKGYLLDTQGQKLNLNVSFQGFLVITKHKSAFLDRFGNLGGSVLEWKGMGLANDGDTVALLKEGSAVDSFTYQKVDKNTTWQKIGEWKKCFPTPFKENDCTALSAESVQPLPSQPTQNQQNSQNDTLQKTQKEQESLSDDSLENRSAPQKLQQNKSAVLPQENVKEAREEDSNAESERDLANVEPSIIRLTGKDIKTVYTSRNEKIKEYAVYGFALFCVLLVILLMMKRNGGVV